MNEPADRPASTRVELERLYDREVATVHGFLLARCGSAATAEDLTAEVFVDAARRFGEGRGREVTTGWLITVAKRRLIDHWRWADRERQRLDRVRREPRRAGPDDHDERVLRALRSLSERQRIALTLRYLDDLSVSEVADTMEIEYSTAESLLARARRSFARAFEGTP